MTSYSILNQKDITFDSYYEELYKLFGAKELLSVVSANNVNVLPKEIGVYVIRKKNIKPLVESIIYIGMTGKFRKDHGFNSSNTIRDRKSRNTPYKFSEDVFEYGPKYVKRESRDYPPKAGYKTQIKLEEIEIDCFCCTTDFMTPVPAYLEAELLQIYLIEKEDLPPANNEL